VRIGPSATGSPSLETRVEGVDPGAPRALSLWRLDAPGGVRELARTRSAHGGFVFERLRLPGTGAHLAVGAQGTPPPGRESGRSGGARPVVPPDLACRGGRLQAAPAQALHALVLEDDRGVELRRLAAGDPFWIGAAAASDTGPLYVHALRSDGARSTRRRLDARACARGAAPRRSGRAAAGDGVLDSGEGGRS